MRKVNKAGVRLIKEFESCRLRAYLDSVNVPTIGWGTTRGVKMGMTITQAEADRLFANDLAEFAAGVDGLIETDVNDNEFAAMVSLAYNIGLKAFGRSSLLRCINRGDFDSAANEFLKWNKAGGKVLAGLTRRRKAERKLFLTPDDNSPLALTEPQAVSATNDIRNAVADITPSSEPAVQPEQPAQAKVEIKDGNILASTSEGKPPDPETVVIEKPEPKSFAAEIKKDLGWVTGGEVGLQGIRDTAEKWNLFGLSARFWLWISIIALVVGAVYIGTKMYKHWMDSRRDMQITQSLIEGNTTPTNKVILASKEELEKFKDEKGFKVVTR